MLTSQAIADRERLLSEFKATCKAIPRSRLTPEDVQLLLSAATVIKVRVDQELADERPPASVLSLYRLGEKP